MTARPYTKHMSNETNLLRTDEAFFFKTKCKTIYISKNCSGIQCNISSFTYLRATYEKAIKLGAI